LRSKPLIRRERADRDVDEAIAHLLQQGTLQAALGFIEVLEQACAHIGRHPASGSARYAAELNLPGLRHWPLKNQPYLVFYVERPDHIDVWRILHGKRDVPAWLQQPEIET
jgi:toxin ParE1/3/4